MGGSRGDPFDITEEPKRLESVTARVGAFIQFEPTEYVKELSGSVGPTQGTLTVTYLRIETNMKSYVLYDEGTDLFPTLPLFGVPMPEKEVPFSLPVPENTSIVGFFGRAGGDTLDAIGVYVKSANANTAQETGSYLDESSTDEPIIMVAEAVPIKIGAWGGDGGTEFDVTEPPKRLESMTVRAGDSVDSIGFSYVDETGQKHNLGPFGGTGGQLATIEFATEEYVKKLSGTIDRSSGRMSFVASLEIETNIRTSPFTDATEETSTDKDEETSKDKATASTESKTITDEQTSPIKIGMWGLGEGMEFDVTEPPKSLKSVIEDQWCRKARVRKRVPQRGARLGGAALRPGTAALAAARAVTGRVVLCSRRRPGVQPTHAGRSRATCGQAGRHCPGGAICWSQPTGVEAAGHSSRQRTRGPAPAGWQCSRHTWPKEGIQLEPAEYVKHFSGTTGTYVGSPVVASLKIETNLRVYGPYGKEQSMPFSIPLAENASVVGFFGFTDNLLGAIGVYRRLQGEWRTGAALGHFFVGSFAGDEQGDDLCAICDNGGNVTCCDGGCGRSFHLTDENSEGSRCRLMLGLTKERAEMILADDDKDFICKNCKYKQHQCFACGKLGSSDLSSEAEVFQCEVDDCGRFYHPNCVAKLLYPDNELEASLFGDQVAARQKFTCPIHECIVCKGEENKNDRNMQFAVCRRCPTAYHRECLPRKHEIRKKLGTPKRNHIVFPDAKKQRVPKMLVEPPNEEDIPEEEELLDNTSPEPPQSPPPLASDQNQCSCSSPINSFAPVSLFTHPHPGTCGWLGD
ncbi:protein ENHANCED DOWNY MILDEW 2-like [Panicum miliaceum]|uniref:Protein ENHANCED DOWNY MILDEW 2-like n=1 Tax=Panicum miliaceum TaxID=4540 RepID=A0A3L6SY13_PANMI|nr:protein ENHANCED DOWNY MILDEW 2-like [Panicum miliaceum]